MAATSKEAHHREIPPGFEIFEAAFCRPPPALERILAETRALGFALASEKQTGALLRVLAMSKPGSRILEIGTGTGVGTSWLLDGMDSTSSIISVEIDPKLQAVAREALGADPRLQLICADAALFVAQQPPASFDLIFADAIAGKYECLEETLRLLRHGGLYVVDDMLPQSNWPENHAFRVSDLLARLTRRDDLTGVGVAWASGLVLLTRR